MVAINSKPTHRDAYESSNLRNAADRLGPLVITREISHMPDQKQLFKNVSLSGSETAFCTE